MISLDIARVELRRMFQSPLAWVMLAAVQLLSAIFFYVQLLEYLKPASPFGARGLTAMVVAGTFQIAGVVLLLVSPFLTMRMFSEERRSGTLQLLLSSPVSLTELVLGKFLGVYAFQLCAVIMIALMTLTLEAGTDLDLAMFAAGLIGLALLLATVSAIGMFVSTLTSQPAAAAIGSFLALFLLWIIHLAGRGGTGGAVGVFEYLSLLRHFTRLLLGLFSFTDVLFYLLLIVLFIALSIWRLDALRVYR